MNEDTILHMHQVLLGMLGEAYGGKYKVEDNLIMAVDAVGR